jgi:CheY-like chemotaxis protein
MTIKGAITMKTKQKAILVVEDDHRITEILKIRLRAAGYHVSTARDAVLAGIMATKLRPDLMLLDIVLPGENGLLLAERLQNTPATAGIPVMFLTASSQPGLREQTMALGAVGYFEKPYEAEQLLAAIDGVLGHPLGQPLVARRQPRPQGGGASDALPPVPPHMPPTGAAVDGVQAGRREGTGGVNAWMRRVLAPLRGGGGLPQSCQRRSSRKIISH